MARAWLYTKLLEVPEFKNEILDNLLDPLFRIHLEYPRFEKTRNQISKLGRYDLVIVDKPTKGNELFNDDNS